MWNDFMQMGMPAAVAIAAIALALALVLFGRSLRAADIASTRLRNERDLELAKLAGTATKVPAVGTYDR